MSSPQALSNALKGLMRRVPQPVSIATVKIDAPFPHYHGATLSSLTSVSLAPLPLVAFSLRLPSRLAAAIAAPPSSSSSNSATPSQAAAAAAATPTLAGANVVLHYLSSSQTPLAASFAKALPAPTPSSSAPSTSSSPSPFALHPHTPSAEGIPVLSGCIGAISCRVLGSVPLSAAGLASVGFSSGSLGTGAGYDGEATSELYVAEVVRVEESLPLPPLVESAAVDDAGKGLPLVYHDQRYCGVGTIE